MVEPKNNLPISPIKLIAGDIDAKQFPDNIECNKPVRQVTAIPIKVLKSLAGDNIDVDPPPCNVEYKKPARQVTTLPTNRSNRVEFDPSNLPQQNNLTCPKNVPTFVQIIARKTQTLQLPRVKIVPSYNGTDNNGSRRPVNNKIHRKNVISLNLLKYNGGNATRWNVPRNVESSIANVEATVLEKYLLLQNVLKIKLSTDLKSETYKSDRLDCIIQMYAYMCMCMHRFMYVENVEDILVHVRKKHTYILIAFRLMYIENRSCHSL